VNSTEARDKVQIGLTAAGDARLEALMEQGFFRSEGDCFKFAVAIALALEMPLDEAPDKGFGTKFQAAGGLDRDGLLAESIKLVRPELGIRPYRSAERLAELGLKHIEAHLLAGGRFADLLESCDISA
jgi:hypothetical protein